MLICLIIIISGSLVCDRYITKSKSIGATIGAIISISIVITAWTFPPSWMFKQEELRRETGILLELSAPKKSAAETIYSSKEMPQLRNISFRIGTGKIEHRSDLILSKNISISNGQSDKSELLIKTKIREPVVAWWIFPLRSMTEEVFEIFLPRKNSQNKLKVLKLIFA